MFQALISLLQEKEEPIRSTAAGILAPVYEPSGEGAQRRRGPEGGWAKWLDDIIAKDAVAGKNGQERTTDLAAAFESALKGAQQGDVRAQSSVAMMYASGKGVQQNYEEAGKWWVKAAEGGDLVAARYAWNLYRNGEGVQRNPAIANQLAPTIGEPIQTPRTNTTQTPAGLTPPIAR